MAVTSASLRTKTPQFDPPFEQYTDVWVVQILQPQTQNQFFLKAEELAKKHGFINLGQV